MLGRYLFTLLLTITIEGGVVYLLGFRKSQSMLAIVVINLITHPALNYLILVLGYLSIKITFLLIAALEILVVVVEWQLLVYMFRGSSGRLLITSLLANAASFSIGVLLFWT